MLILYGRHYLSRMRSVADLIPEGSSVVDLCCGPARIYHRYLVNKSVSYVGLDINPSFIARLQRLGGEGQVWDLRSERRLPTVDYLIMQASLYQFLPDARSVVDRMLEAATKSVIIAEPVRNVAASRLAPLAVIASVLSNPGSGPQAHRFDEAGLDRFFDHYSSRVIRSELIAGGREKLYVLDPGQYRER